MYGSYHTHAAFRFFHERLSESGHCVIRGYTYSNEVRYDSATHTKHPPASPWPYSDNERRQLKALEAAGNFCLDDFIDKRGAIKEGMPKTARNLERVLRSVDVFFAAQTECDQMHMCGSANQLELQLADEWHGRTGRPRLVHFGTCDPQEKGWYLKNADRLPLRHMEAAGQLLRLLEEFDRR
jgi:hypothetical protein